MKNKKTVRELAGIDGRVYVYLDNDDTGNAFMRQAEKEGFAFGDGVKPTERGYETIMAVNRDMTINYVGTVGRIAFGSGTETIGNEKLVRVDFAKWLAGEDYH